MKNKTFTLLCLTSIMYITAAAQPVIKKQWVAGGSSEDNLSVMALTKDGGWIAGGSSRSDKSGEKRQNHRGNYDYWVVKYSSSGSIQWSKTLGGNRDDILAALQQTSDGGYILGGSSSSDSSGEKSSNKITGPGADYWVIKLDSVGNKKWDKTIGGNNDEQLKAIDQTTDGGYILGGYSNSNISGNKTENRRGGYDYWVVKINAQGNVQWNKTVGGNNGDYLTSLQQKTDGNYVLGGYSSSLKSGEKTQDRYPYQYKNTLGTNDYWIVGLSKTGIVQWDKTIGGNGDDNLSAIQQTSDGGYILGGSSSSNISFDKTENSKGFEDYWMVKLDKNRNKQWVKAIGGNNTDRLTCLQQTKDSGYILGGLSVSDASFDKTENSKGIDDYWIVKLDKTGAKQMDKTIGGDSLDHCYAVAEKSSNNYLIGGYSRSGISGDKTIAPRGSTDYWIILLEYKPVNNSGLTQFVAGGSDKDYLTTMYLTSDGGWIAGGYSWSNISCQKSENNKGYINFWVVKYNAAGNIQWDKTLGGNQFDELNAIQQTSDGGYILGGTSSSYSSGDKTEDSRGFNDYWIIKIDGNGNKQWDKTFGGSEQDDLRALQQTSDGGYILGGFSYSGISGDKTQTSRGGPDYWIIKTDKNGNKQWDKTIGASGYNTLFAIQQTADGGYILGGSSTGYKSGEKTEISRGAYDYWIVKLNAQGTIQWDKTIGGETDDQLASIRQTSDGGYILGGYSNSNSSFEKTENRRGSYDYWVVKVNSSGQILWDKTVGGTGEDHLTSLQQTTDGGFLLGGFSNSGLNGEKTEISKGAYDYWVVKLSGTGSVQWDKTVGGESDDQCYSVKEVSSNHYLLGGYSNSVPSGDKTIANCTVGSYPDYWIVSLNYPGSGNLHRAVPDNKSPIVASKAGNTNFNFYPNPAQNIVRVQLKSPATVSLIDVTGKLLSTKTITGSGSFNVANLKAGMYYLRNNATGETQKLIVSH